MSEWQPIESAPKDGTEIILYNHDAAHGCSGVFVAGYDTDSRLWKGTYAVGRYHDNGYLRDAMEFSHFMPATHWMPLPPPPAEGGEK